MKKFKIFVIAAATICLTAVVGCEEDKSHDYTNMTPLGIPSPYFDDDAISRSELVLVWDSVSDAYTYSVRWWKEGDEANATISEISSSSSSQRSLTLRDLESLTTYYAQVRSNAYPGYEVYSSDYCDAVSCATNNVAKANIDVSLYQTSSSTLTYEWELEGSGVEGTILYDYYIELYTAETCDADDLFVSWVIDKSCFNAEEEGVIPYARFTFSSLDPGTTYWMKISVNGDAENYFSNPLAGTTDTFDYVSVDDWTGDASVGDVILAQDFRGLIHGGDMGYKAIAITTIDNKVRGDYIISRGINPTDYAMPVEYSDDFNVFTGKTSDEYIASAGLADWCIGNSTNSSTRPGYIRLGAASGKYGYLATPELSMIPEGKTATVKVECSVMSYYQDTNETEYGKEIMIAVVDNVVVDSEYQVKGWETDSDSAEPIDRMIVDISDAKGKNFLFGDKSVTLTGVTNTCRIRFSSNSESDSNKTRFLLDNIVITITDLQ